MKTNSAAKLNLVCSAALSMVATAPAWAQAEATDEVPDEIIVTATRQSQAINKVPISISAFSEEQLQQQGVKSVADIARLTPGLNFDSSNNFIAIRGISSLVGAGTTGIYIDETPIQIRGVGAFPQNTLPALFDVDRVEVLRGPQGTLFGAGSMGGTLRYITPQPKMSGTSLYGRLEGSLTEHGSPSFEAGGAVGTALVEDKVGLRLSAYYRDEGGYIDRVDRQTGVKIADDVNDSHIVNINAAIAFALSDDITVTPSLYFQQRKADARSDFWESYSDRKNHQFVTADVPTPASDRFVLPALKVEWNLGGVDLISNTSYLDRRARHIQDFSQYVGGVFRVNTPFGPNFPTVPEMFQTDRSTTTQENWVQELRLQRSDPTDRLNWVVGAFYSNARQYNQELAIDTFITRYVTALTGLTPLQLFGADPVNDVGVDSRITTRDVQYAVFADVGFKVTDKLKLTVGGRYSRTKFSFDNYQEGPFNGGVTQGSGTNKQNPFTPKFNVSYQADSDNLFYATASKGFRIGGANKPVSVTCNDELALIGLSQVPQTYDGDSVWSYEAGTKNNLFGRKLQIAASVYRVDWKNIQQNVSLASCGWSYIANAGNVRSEGFDLQLSARPAEGLTLSGNVGYNHLKFTKDIVNEGTLGTADVNYMVRKGDTLNISPWSGAAALEYDFNLGERQSFFRADYQYQGKVTGRVTELNPTAGSYDPDYRPTQSSHFVTLRAGTKFGNLGAELFVNNVFDATPALTHTHTQVGNPVFFETTFRPRTFGLTLTYRN
ncbi:MAG: TonB-dependent receptor [Pseudomonadota bacterium]|nr:TonB-dependent receptor [Pseudomonadota bacterium]